MGKPRATLARQELVIMKVVWRNGSATVRDVYEALREQRRIAYTTVMTTMNVLADKGYLHRALEGRAYRYRPAHPEDAVVKSMVQEFIDRVFDGASRPLFQHLVEHERLTEAERAELVRLIERME